MHWLIKRSLILKKKSGGWGFRNWNVYGCQSDIEFTS